MRFILLLAAALHFPLALWAQDILVSAPVVAATVFSGSARITHEISLDLPAGRHRLLFPFDFDDIQALPDVTPGPGVTVVGLGVTRNIFPEPDVFFSAAQRAAKSDMETAERAVLDQQDRIADATQVVSALRAQFDFVKAIRAPQEAKLSSEELLALADTIHDRTLQIVGRIDAIDRQIRDLTETLHDRLNALKTATGAFEQLASATPAEMLGTITIDVANAGNATLSFTTWSFGAGWQPTYDIDLAGEGSAELTINRRVVVFQGTGDPWSDIALTVSTADTDQSVTPSEPFASRAFIVAPQPERDLASVSGGVVLAAPVMEANQSSFGVAETDGLAVVYRFEQPVTILGEEGVGLFLDSLKFSATTEIQASPRYDDTAYLVATFTNDGAEPILAGRASFYRDNELVGRSEIAQIPANVESELSFGAIQGIRLSWNQVRNATGDAGIIQRSNTREQTVSFDVQNLTGETRQVRAVYALPFSEQEDLEVEVKSDPQPNEMDVDGKRGVGAWDMTLQPGEKRQVDLQFLFDFTEGWDLQWRP